MSGLSPGGLQTIATVHSASSTVGQASGLTPPNQLHLGTVAFLDEETPDELSFKLNQVLCTHVLIGGSRTIQALGPSMEDITWEGYLFAGNVAYRIGQLESMNVSAQPVDLSFLSYSYSVVVKNFTWKFEHAWQAKYSITVTILEDTSGQYTRRPPIGIGQQVFGISQAAQTVVSYFAAQDAVGFASAEAACNLMFYAIEAAGVIEQLTGPELQALLQVISNALVACELYQAGLT